MSEKTDTLKAYEAARDHLHTVCRCYTAIPEKNEELERQGVEALKEAAIDFYHAEAAAWQAGDFKPRPTPTF